jgi:Family of unknown function (DUF5984)
MAEKKHDAGNQFRIAFNMDEVQKVTPWGKAGEYKLHWYGLTSGRFWIETQHGNPLEYTSAIQSSWSLLPSTPDYFVARLFEDSLSLTPLILEQVPVEIAERVANIQWRVKAEQWRDSIENELRWDRWYSATRWWHDRTLDLGYLQNAPELAFWRVGNNVFLQWNANEENDNGIPVWTLPEGQTSVTATLFEAGVFELCEELLKSMERRIQSILENGWQRADCILDLDELVSEQRRRREFFSRMISEKATTDWRQVSSDLDVLLALMGEPMTGGPKNC